MALLQLVILINVPTSCRGNVITHCDFAFSNEALTRTIAITNANNIAFLSCNSQFVFELFVLFFSIVR